MVSVSKKFPCPTCKKMLVYSVDNPFRPFCSERCKNFDTAAWADESYAVEAEDQTDDEL